MTACFHITSPHPLVASPTRPLIAPAGYCVTSQHAALSLSCRLVVLPLVVLSCQLVVASSSLVVLSFAPPSCSHIVLAGCCIPLLVPLSGCRIASHRPLIVPPSRCLVKSAGCRISSCCSLVAPPSCQLIVLYHCLSLSSRCAPRYPLFLSLRRMAVASPLNAPPSRHLFVLPLVVSLRQLVVAPSSLVVLSLHHPLLLSLCWLVVAFPLLAPSSCPLVKVHRQRHQTLSNNAATIEHNRHRRQ